VRDLSKLNRDLGKVLLIACDPDAYNLQPENAIKVGLSPVITPAADTSSWHPDLCKNYASGVWTVYAWLQRPWRLVVVPPVCV